MATLEVEIIPVLADNYVYLVRESGSGATAIIDPPVVEPVLERLAEKGWKATWILATHHHTDHVDGILELKRQTGAEVAGPAADRARVPGIDLALSEGDHFRLGAAEALVFDTPGHTRGHISYWFKDGALFCADTLFSLGCGRLFEGTAEQMWSSLEKLRRLPAETLVYCGHEYTQSNARFALTIDPENPALQARAREVDQQRAQGLPTIPTTIGAERAANPFLRPDDPVIRRRLEMESASDAEVFGEIRQRKDNS